MDKEFEPRSVGIHSGDFHADEVTTCAVLLFFDLIDRDKILRSRDQSKLDNCEYICDVGGIYDPERKLFDHHQFDYQGELSSAGMVLEYLFHKGIIPCDEFELLRDYLIRGVDFHDNGKPLEELGVCTFSDVIANYSPICYSAGVEEQNDAFNDALDFAFSHVSRLLERHRYVCSFKSIIAAAMEKDEEYLFFDKALPWIENFFALGGENHPAKFVIMPSRQGWKLRGIPPSDRELMQVRVPLPEEWAGFLEGELEKVTGIKGSIFCHKGRFISIWETREAAEQAYDVVMKRIKN